MAKAQLLDHRGQPLSHRDNTALAVARQQLATARREVLRAKYDAAQTVTGNELHWANADHLDPHSASEYKVRRTLRSRSRYEVIENNPFLKGIILTIANDFVGTGPKLSITDPRIPKARRVVIERRFSEWVLKRRIRQKLWRARIAKIVDGETFLRAFSNTRQPYDVSLDFQVLECDRVTTQFSGSISQVVLGRPTGNQVDGVRFDQFETPEAYHILHVHPGFTTAFSGFGRLDGEWVDASKVIHWFRQDRGWMRGIPETTPSLPLCSVLRRYTLAVLRHAEVAADFTAIIQSEGPPNLNAWTDEQGNLLQDDPFDTFPIEQGMVTNLPWGYTLTQLDSVPLGVQYDHYVGALLREITRPILVPYNLSIGSSKDSNMASAVVDIDVYKGGQKAERSDCNEVALDHMFALWWDEAGRVPGYFDAGLDDFIRMMGFKPHLLSRSQYDRFAAYHSTLEAVPFDRDIFAATPSHRWRWDTIGLDHTDPQKVANALQALHDKRFATDRDIQEGYFNRSVEEWQDEIADDDAFRSTLVQPEEETVPTDDE